MPVEASEPPPRTPLPEVPRPDMYPPAATSQWSIVEPSEPYEAVVGAADAPRQTATELTWRARLRTGIERTDLVGVRFRDSEIRPGP
jgi:hypothetical protein